MPEETIRTRPRLCLARAWTFQMGPALNLENAEEWAQLALQAAATRGEPESDITGEVAALRAMVAATRIEIALSRELSRQALDSLPSDSPWRGVMTFCLGTAHFLSGEMAAATQVFEEALRHSQAEGAYYIQLATASFLGEIRVFEGHLNRAIDIYQQVLEWAAPNLPQKGGVMAHGGLAYILCERNQLDAALPHIQVGTDQLDQVGGAWAAFVIYRALARVQQAKGHWSEALEALDRAHQVGLRTQISLVAEQAAALRARLYLDQGDLAAAEAWAEGSGLSLHDPAASRPGLREVEYLSLARVLDTQGRHAEAQSLLDRLMGAAQAERKDGSAISILTLQALVGQAQGNRVHAFERLEQALTLAEPEGYIRVFVEEGESLRALLHDYRSQLSTSPGDSSRRLLAYTNKLLAAFPVPGVQAPLSPDPLLDPLSKRELEVLQLIATGASNQEVADALVVAMPTVKKHVSNILSKLNATGRTQAVAEARALGLL
jgi:LuxR family maltose regulon positive regulatory protein